MLVLPAPLSPMIRLTPAAGRRLASEKRRRLRRSRRVTCMADSSVQVEPDKEESPKKKTPSRGRAFHVKHSGLNQRRKGITTWRQRSFDASRTIADELASRRANTTLSSRKAVKASSR